MDNRVMLREEYVSRTKVSRRKSNAGTKKSSQEIFIDVSVSYFRLLASLHMRIADHNECMASAWKQISNFNKNSAVGRLTACLS